MKLQRSRIRLILLLLVCAFLAVFFFGSRHTGLLPELPSLPSITETAVPEASVSPSPDSTPGLTPDTTYAPGTEPSASPAEVTPAPEIFDLYGL